MSDLNLLFTGIGLCYFDEEIKNWRVLMPKIENNHDFQVKIEKNTNNVTTNIDYLKIPLSSKINILNDSISPEGNNDESRMLDTLDINALHQEEKGIILFKDKTKYAAFVKLNGFSLETDLSEGREGQMRFYNVWKATPNLKTKLESEFSGRKNVVSRKISPQIGSKTIIFVNGEEVYSIVHENNFNYKIIFDNDCHTIHSDPDKLSDFQYYYNIIDWESLADPCKFELSPIPAKCDYVGCDLVKVGRPKPRIPEELLEYINS